MAIYKMVNAQKPYRISVRLLYWRVIMINYNLGVSTEVICQIKRLDSDFFSDDNDWSKHYRDIESNSAPRFSLRKKEGAAPCGSLWNMVNWNQQLHRRNHPGLEDHVSQLYMLWDHADPLITAPISQGRWNSLLSSVGRPRIQRAVGSVPERATGSVQSLIQHPGGAFCSRYRTVHAIMWRCFRRQNRRKPDLQQDGGISWTATFVF